MKVLLHEPTYLEDAAGNRHLVAGLVEVDAQGKLLGPPVPEENEDAGQAAPEAPVQLAPPSAG